LEGGGGNAPASLAARLPFPLATDHLSLERNVGIFRSSEDGRSKLIEVAAPVRPLREVRKRRSSSRTVGQRGAQLHDASWPYGRGCAREKDPLPDLRICDLSKTHPNGAHALQQRISVVVKGTPPRAGVDPRLLLIDRNWSDDLRPVIVMQSR
jgi:hypothetical protein